MGEFSSCSCLTALPGPAWVLLSKTFKPFRPTQYTVVVILERNPSLAEEHTYTRYSCSFTLSSSCPSPNPGICPTAPCPLPSSEPQKLRRHCSCSFLCLPARPDRRRWKKPCCCGAAAAAASFWQLAPNNYRICFGSKRDASSIIRSRYNTKQGQIYPLARRAVNTEAPDLHMGENGRNPLTSVTELIQCVWLWELTLPSTTV